MRRLIVILPMFLVVSCGDDSFDNLVDFTFQGESLSWGSNDGSCQMRNQSSNMYCFIEAGRHPDQDDLSFSLGVHISEQIEESTYTDVRDAANPNVDIGLWIEDRDNELRYFETPVSNADPLTLTITRLESSTVRGNFDGVIECDETGQSETISASFFMTLNQ